MAALLLPVISGGQAFFLRDVFSVHLEMRHALTADGGSLLVDPFRGGGQPAAYNPNTVAFYPTALAHRVLPFFAAFNLHLWLHLLLAPLTLYWLARELGLGRRGAWAAGVTWGFSGFLVSQLAFYNLIAGVTLAPALAAAAVRWCRLRRATPASGAMSLVAVGLLWALLVTAGDPQTAVVALAAALGLALATPDRRRTLPWLAAALAAGTLVALPQILGLLAILPASARGAGYGEAMRGAGSFDPRQALGWLLPFADGRPDLVGPGGFWGYRFHQGSWPFYFTLYPGLATIALAAAAGLPRWHRRGAGCRMAVLRRGWALLAAGLFLALGAFNPLVNALLSLPGLDAMRYPLKFWLLAAMGTSLLAGVGFARAFDPPPAGAAEPQSTARRRVMLALLALAAFFAAVWLALRLVPGTADAIHALMPPGMHLDLAQVERSRWAALTLISTGAALALAALAYLAGRRPRLGGVLLLTLHAALQLWLLRPAMVTEPTLPYRDEPPILAAVPVDERVAHGSFEGLFGAGGAESGDLPAPEVRWIFRRTFVEAYPFAGALHGRRYDLNPSPEWLDTAELRQARAVVADASDDATRVRLLSAWGISRLLTHRSLELPEVASGVSALAERVASEPSIRRQIHAYRLPGAAPGVYLATGRIPLPPTATPASAGAILAHPRFRPGRDVVLPARADGEADTGVPTNADPGGPPGRVRVLVEDVERLEVTTAADGPGVLVWQRAHLPLHRAWVDGEEVEPRTVNLYRLGVPVPPGEHRVRVEVSRRLLHGSVAGSAAGLAALLGLGFLVRRRSPRERRPGAESGLT